MSAALARLDADARGVYLITVTPFTDAGALDLASTDRMVDFCLAAGVTGLTVLGIMGEATKLTAEESRLFVKQVLARVAGRVPVVVGASAAGFAPMRELTQSVMELGASGVMVAPPATVRTDDQIVAYFEMVQETLGPDVPWVLQDHPVATGVQMSAGVILRIIAKAPGCVMLKHEDCPGLAKLSAIRAASQRGDARRVSILTGNGGGLFLPEELLRGADGAMTGFAYPEMMVDVCRAHAQGSSSGRRISSTPTCRWRATSSSRASVWRCASTSWPRAASSRPAASGSPAPACQRPTSPTSSG